MLFFIALLFLLFVALSTVDASPLHNDAANRTLSFTARVNAKRATNIVAADKARAQAMKHAGRKGKRDGSSFSITNAVVDYTTQVDVGSPATEYILLIDTGSSNTWIGANPNNHYNPTSTSVSTGGSVSVSYGSGAFSGLEYTDTVTLSSDLVITQQFIGVADSAWGIDVDGFLGVGPTDLTQGTVSNVYDVPTVTDNLKSQGIIDTEALGIYFIPSSAYDSTGELTFGGYDSSKIAGGMNYVPFTTTSPASAFWGIDQSITYGTSSSTILSETSGIVDTGTTLILIATDAFNRYQSTTSATIDESTGLLTISSDRHANLQTLTFNIGGIAYPLTPNAQIWPRSLNANIGDNSNSIYLVVSDIGSESGSGLDFINGYAFLQRYYSVYDTINNRAGFASAGYTDATSN